VTETETEAVTVTGFAWTRSSSRPPDSGPRTPDSGNGDRDRNGNRDRARVGLDAM